MDPAAFNGGPISRDAGGLWLRELGHGFEAALKLFWTDGRSAPLTRPSVQDIATVLSRGLMTRGCCARLVGMIQTVGTTRRSGLDPGRRISSSFPQPRFIPD